MEQACRLTISVQCDHRMADLISAVISFMKICTVIYFLSTVFDLISEHALISRPPFPPPPRDPVIYMYITVEWPATRRCVDTRCGA